MREIKFRGVASCDVTDEYGGEFVVKEGQIIFGQAVFDETRPFIVGPVLETCSEYISLERWCPIRPENGTDIYENDKVTCMVNGKPHGAPDRIMFEDGEFRLANRNRSIRDWMLLEELHGQEVDCHVEVIGHIYEEPK